MRKLEIINWEKYQPRNDVKHSSWYRFEHAIHFDPDWLHFDGQEIHVFNFLLGMASFKNKSVFTYAPDYFATVARVPVEKVRSAIDKLIEKQVVRITENNEHGDVTDAVRERSPTDERTNGRTDETNTHDDAAAPSRQDFEQIYQVYPRKEGKAKGIEKCKAQIRTPEALEELRQAVLNYRDHCKREGKQRQYVQHFSTFMERGAWRDWLDPETGTTDLPIQGISSTHANLDAIFGPEGTT